MTREKIKKEQEEERRLCLQKILDSKAPKKLIVAGAGTGKTYTFRESLKLTVGGTNLVMTFIRKLVADMESSLGPVAEVKTFHAYCKKILHEKNGRAELVPFLTKIIEGDAVLLEQKLAGFDEKFRTLVEASPEIAFYLERGDYYEVVGFDDSVYRLYKELETNPGILPVFDQILIDEFQDFNPLEVAFINILASKGEILIVGDDDQAVYDGRSASPSFLRELYRSGDFELFELPFCSRCPEVIVTSINSLIERALKAGHFEDRIAKRYECYLNDKEADSVRYPKILLAQCTTAKVVGMYIEREIAKIDPADIAESHTLGYPTVLIVGSKQYLREIEKRLSKTYEQVSYSPSPKLDYGAVDGYKFLLGNERSNLGWRILAEMFLGDALLKDTVARSRGSSAVIDLLDRAFVDRHLHALDLIRAVMDAQVLTRAQRSELNTILDSHSKDVLTAFEPHAAAEEKKIDTTAPTILLTSFRGCKGLSAGHVFIVGAHDGSMPRDPRDIQDVEISQFIVALSRTRKQCHIVSNKWLVSPVDAKKKFVKPNLPSRFVSWIAKESIEDTGEFKAGDFKSERNLVKK